MRSKQLGQLLLENGDVSAEHVAKALKTQEQQGGLTGQVLQQMGACNANAIASALLKQVQVTDIKCEDMAVDPEVAALVPRETCETEKLCPFERLGNLLCVVMGNPLNRKAITAIEEKTRLKVKSFKSVWPKISELIQRTYDGGAAVPQGLPAAGQADASPEMPSLESESLTLDEPALGGVGSGLDEAPVLAAEPVLDLEPPAQATPEPQPEAPIIQPAQAPNLFVPRRVLQPVASPTIKGLDTLDDSAAEVVETTRRGLSARGKKVVVDEPAKPKPEKKAKVNVDLDQFDITGGAAVSGTPAAAAASPALARVNAMGEPLTGLRQMDVSYFYAEGSDVPTEPTSELAELFESLPVAETVAQSVGEYEESLRAAVAIKPAPAAVAESVAAEIPFPAAPKRAPRPLELQPSPSSVMSAVAVSEAEFKKDVTQLGEDPVGEWDWRYAAAGPVPALVCDE